MAAWGPRCQHCGRAEGLASSSVACPRPGCFAVNRFWLPKLMQVFKCLSLWLTVHGLALKGDGLSAASERRVAF